MGKDLKKKIEPLAGEPFEHLGYLVPIFHRCIYCQQSVSHGVLPGHPPVWTIGSAIPVRFPLDLLRERLSKCPVLCAGGFGMRM